MTTPVWQQPEIIRWIQIVSDSYRQLLGKDLIDSANTPEQLSKALFYVPFVLVSHGTQADPIFNYGNQTALQLWSLSWDEFIKTPSAASAEPVARAERALMLKQAKEQGYIENYEGVRISSQGKRFLIKQVTLWNLTDESGQKCGQAATYPSWEWL
ncbi:MEKHLA domain-containing protein [Pleurocapsa sp. CCALA 161]|uniref:MEKHLA domain-containing protein n=1 Tax=Pleurocapsa sp. CCALA 161 TaxID=2107688 RepID=UPI000D08066E|nr:MEKHLA domain-containing protein [Pleurocapsa sp. CCALA 161]PSB07890.1 MEKHLA domain-containing protein [Pleurocapsa sp. CCALA 161]